MKQEQQRLVAVLIALMFIVPVLWYLKTRDGDDLTPLGSTGLWKDEDGNTRIGEGGPVYDGEVESVVPDALLAGQVNELTLEGEGPVVLLQPEQAMATFQASDGPRVQNATYLELAGSDTFHLLVAPTATEIELAFYGHGGFTFDIPVIPGPEPLISGELVYDMMLTVTDDDNPPGYEDGYNGRWYSPSNPYFMRAAQFFRDTLDSYGLDAEIQTYTPDGEDNPTIINVVAIKWGQDRNTFIGVGGHMDVVAPVAPGVYGTLQGAYDDTSGTVSTIMLARAISELDTQNTYFFGLWAAEEEGIHGSSHFVNNFHDNYPGSTIKAYLNMDMVGIGWPGTGGDGEDYPIHGYIGGLRTGQVTEPIRGYEAIVNWTAHHFLGYPEVEAFELGHSNFGRSDHVPFQREGVPCTFYIGPHDGQYTEYHQMEDTLSNMEDWMGGEEEMREGFGIYAWMALGNLLLLDSEDPG